MMKTLSGSSGAPSIFGRTLNFTVEHLSRPCVPTNSKQITCMYQGFRKALSTTAARGQFSFMYYTRIMLSSRCCVLPVGSKSG